MTRDRYFKIRSSLKVVVDTDVSDDAKKQDGYKGPFSALNA